MSTRFVRVALIALLAAAAVGCGNQESSAPVAANANTPDGRRAAIEPYLGWIGERWFVLPNPTYGAWEPALFNNDWARPAAERRKAKMDALRVQ